MRTLLAIAMLVTPLAAQEKSEFDAASIKPNTSVRVGLMINTSKSGDFVAENVTLRNLIAYAWRVKEFQTVGGPKWLDSDHYDILAKPPHDGVTSGDRNRLRMRALLADRFQLAVHTGTKEMFVYALAVAKNGPRLEPATGDSPRKGIEGRRGIMTCRAASMKSFAEWGLAPRLGNIVLDKTGLEGEFDFTVRYADDSPPKPGVEVEAPDPSLPDLASALQQQLGLKLETQKAPVEVIVVDHAEKASAN
ncbi:MAG TPA: TIGR03435 family protein [Bryobacteraceae bacterium]|nr:TIGR03435 family protein [Bryobacteraceae bacterium]